MFDIFWDTGAHLETEKDETNELPPEIKRQSKALQSEITAWVSVGSVEFPTCASEEQ